MSSMSYGPGKGGVVAGRLEGNVCSYHESGFAGGETKINPSFAERTPDPAESRV